MEATINGHRLRLVEGDITELATDAIVNAANQYLQLGAGVAGAIRMKGGPSIQRECDAIGHCPVGDAATTGGGNLKAKYVIHAVGPRNSNPDAEVLLASVTRASLREADAHDMQSIAFPAISTGVFGFPMDRCAEIMLAEVIKAFAENATDVAEVVFCLYGQAAFDLFRDELTRQTASL
jgi:O-acetyl-ADP-ribose deacetylase (regulator of RNase III)